MEIPIKKVHLFCLVSVVLPLIRGKKCLANKYVFRYSAPLIRGLMCNIYCKNDVLMFDIGNEGVLVGASF